MRFTKTIVMMSLSLAMLTACGKHKPADKPVSLQTKLSQSIASIEATQAIDAIIIDNAIRATPNFPEDTKKKIGELNAKVVMDIAAAKKMIASNDPNMEDAVSTTKSDMTKLMAQMPK